MAVSHRADEIDNPAILFIIKKAPSLVRVPSSGTDPALRATDSATGNRTPDRAVLLGNAGAIRASVAASE